MFPGDDQLQKLINVVGPLEFSLKLPTDADEYFAVTGVMSQIPEDRRRFARTHMRVVAALQHRCSLPSLARPLEWHKVVMRDISRNGVGFLHSQQLYPTEQLALVMPDGKPRYIEVVRCFRIGELCYEIGAKLIQEFRSAKVSEELVKK